ncbi:MAG: polyphosphate:AMP phosphotransferase [Deltaproteobacteria bacterium]|nr:polyphosphate:AMP phosphotransferase [Deltaproteobacteria bacterium]
MFESASLSHRMEKAQYREEESRLREALLNTQYDLKEAGRFPVLILIAGVEGAGKSEAVNLLNEWMDPRHISVSAFASPEGEELEHPPMWRFWRALPPKGRIGIFFGAWHTQPILDRVRDKISDAQLSEHIADILRFEKMLSDEGVLLVKLWFHLSKEQQKRRLKALEKDPRTRWRATREDWRRYRAYDEYARTSEIFLRRTSTGEAPWRVVPGADPAYRAVSVGRHLLEAMRERLSAKRVSAESAVVPSLPPPLDQVNVLRALTLDQPLEKSEYERELEKWQGRLNTLSREPRFNRLAVVGVFEGNDAAGKGGAIRRVTSALDARRIRTVPIAAPTEEERAQPYLWRFWRHLPRAGSFTLFDRSWYGRVLVERVEGYCSESDWRRAYSEINDFEQQLVRHGLIVAKFWLAISKEEQLARFKAREVTTFKRFKITEDDWRNREKWEAYERAVCEMVDRTSTSIAPWTLVEANNKYAARIKVLSTLVRAIEEAL